MRGLLFAVVVVLAAPAMQGPEGTAVVRGRVVDALTGQPLANVTLRFGHRPRGSYAPGIDPQPPDRTAITNAEGVFEVARLAAGDYGVSAPVASGDYLSIQYGVNAPDGLPRLLTVTDGARLEITIKAWRGARIEGHVFDERGRPIVDANVRLFSDDSNVYASGSTDDRGAYEIARLGPGRYAVGVPIRLSNRTVSSSPRPASFGGLLYPYAMDRTRRTILMVDGAPLAPSADDGRTRLYESVFAGGATTRAGAAIYTLAAGDVRTDIDITLPAVRGTRVAGVVSAPGKVEGTILTLTKPGTSVPFDGRIDTTAASDGSFVFVAVPPGRYTLTGYRHVPPLSEMSLSSGAPLGGMDDVIMRDPDDAWLEMPIAIGDADVDDLALRLRVGTAISGRMVFDDGGALPTQWPRVQLAPFADRTGISFEDRPVQFGADGVMSMRIKPGTYRVLSQSWVPGRKFKTAIVNGIDIGDGPLVVGTESIADIQFVFGRHDTSVRGTVADPAGQPLARGTVLVFPVDRRRWIRLEENGRGVIAQAPRGAYAISNLAPGDYYVVAIDSEQNSLQPRFLEPLVPRATRISLRAGEPVILPLVVPREEP